MIKPNMGTEPPDPPASSLADALFPKVRQRVLAVLFGNPARSFYANEVIALAGSGTGAVQRELAGLSQAGLLTVSRQGNQRHYQANAEAPVFAELRGLVLKTSGVADVLRTALLPLEPQIRAAFVFGSIASQQDTARRLENAIGHRRPPQDLNTARFGPLMSRGTQGADRLPHP